MSKKNRPTDSGGNWMDTYGDMVTLLLTFFIMLYSMSNLDAQKWTIFVKSIPSIQNQGSENITINSQMSDTPEVDSKGQEIGQEIAQEALQAEDVNELYLTIAESLNQAGVKEATVIRGDDILMFLLQIMCFSVQTAPCLHGKDRQSSIHLQKP